MAKKYAEQFGAFNNIDKKYRVSEHSFLHLASFSAPPLPPFLPYLPSAFLPSFVISSSILPSFCPSSPSSHLLPSFPPFCFLFYQLVFFLPLSAQMHYFILYTIYYAYVIVLLQCQEFIDVVAKNTKVTLVLTKKRGELGWRELQGDTLRLMLLGLIHEEVLDKNILVFSPGRGS